MSKDLKLFLSKAVIALLPFVIVLGIYVYEDPFKVLRSYERYYDSGEAVRVVLNNDYLATEIVRTQWALRKYDSFILGSSRSRFFEMADWQQYIQSTNCFHFDASTESLFGVHKKIHYLDSIGAGISNALIVLDHNLLSVTNNHQSHLLRKHPALSGESPLIFHAVFLKAFLDVNFLTAYLSYLTSGRIDEKVSKERILDTMEIDYDAYFNEIRFRQIEAMIATNQQSYYSEKKNLFYERSTMLRYADQVIDAARLSMLSEICVTLRKHRCRYKIIISPLYNQKKINPDDFRLLQNIFGADNVYDFSGINNFTQSHTNYYETSHYRPHVAREILKTIYQ
jgi:hypothetical protein